MEIFEASSRALTVVGLLVVSASLGACGDPAEEATDTADVCVQAADLIEECNGTRPEQPLEGCVGTFATTSQEIVDGGCEAASAQGGKADEGGWWCLAINRWLGICRDIPTLEEAAELPPLSQVCPASRQDDLCVALRDDDPEAARTAAAAALADDLEARRDPALHHYIRERNLALLVWNRLTALGAVSVGSAAYATQADAVLKEHLPVYDPREFSFARQLTPPLRTQDCAPGEARAELLFFPGVMRIGDRNEWDEQAAALADALPCLASRRVETGSFTDPGLNASKGRLALDDLDAEFGELPVHVLGYSQGAMNGLRLLVDDADVAARAQSMLTLNSAAHGSEVGDTLYAVVNHLDLGTGRFCDQLPEFAQPTCAWALAASPVPADFLLQAITLAMGLPPNQVKQFIEAEGGVEAAPSVAEFFIRHRKGVRSPTVEGAQEFWSTQAADLPQTVLYQSVRAVISNTWRNLPHSNALLYKLISRAGPDSPFNDMQVRLVNQSLGGPVADLEVQSAVLEGNHWQWAVADRAVPEAVMPVEMSQRIPRRALLVAHYQTLDELGLPFP